jgi:5-methylcytosine-specific restriction enzyme A
MKLEIFIVFLITAIYFKANNTLNRLSILKNVFTSNYIVNVLLILIIAVILSSYIGRMFRNKNSVSADEILEEFNFVTDVRNVTTSGKVKQKEIVDEFKQKVADNQNNLCNHCGKRIVLVTEFNIDYILPLSRGGENNIANSQALCNNCCDKKNSIDKYLQ